jgi:hypothetical protein
MQFSRNAHSLSLDVATSCNGVNRPKATPHNDQASRSTLILSRAKTEPARNARSLAPTLRQECANRKGLVRATPIVSSRGGQDPRLKPASQSLKPAYFRYPARVFLDLNRDRLNPLSGRSQNELRRFMGCRHRALTPIRTPRSLRPCSASGSPQGEQGPGFLVCGDAVVKDRSCETARRGRAQEPRLPLPIGDRARFTLALTHSSAGEVRMTNRPCSVCPSQDLRSTHAAQARIYACAA